MILEPSFNNEFRVDLCLNDQSFDTFFRVGVQVDLLNDTQTTILTMNLEWTFVQMTNASTHFQSSSSGGLVK